MQVTAVECRPQYDTVSRSVSLGGSCCSRIPTSALPVAQILYPKDSVAFYVSIVSSAPQLLMIFVMTSPLGRLVPFSLRITSMLGAQGVVLLLLGFCAQSSIELIYSCFAILGMAGVVSQCSLMGVTRLVVMGVTR